mmetsp:Transcript_14675/g.25888  ORF Transcript_14675/g.25888 Transcript_14675/m.25888 type:complete len:202 (-) Transcript_14675:87-692(-)
MRRKLQQTTRWSTAKKPAQWRIPLQSTPPPRPAVVASRISCGEAGRRVRPPVLRILTPGRYECAPRSSGSCRGTPRRRRGKVTTNTGACTPRQRCGADTGMAVQVALVRTESRWCRLPGLAWARSSCRVNHQSRLDLCKSFCFIGRAFSRERGSNVRASAFPVSSTEMSHSTTTTLMIVAGAGPCMRIAKLIYMPKSMPGW